MSKYYGVIGNRDYIKRNGKKRPFWEYLDRQPDGYLTSLVYMRKDLPRTHMIFDCGAWSYKGEEVPPITPISALDAYRKLAWHGSFLIAPDHMLIDGVDLDSRRDFNAWSAREFFKITPNDYIPMATAHGMGIEERIRTTQHLVGLGYTHIAIGGVAARAAQKKLVMGMVSSIREEFPDIWLHVLGLSSPPYTKKWNDIGIDSFDGSSHFKQAFTGGAFFTVEYGKLKKWQAARPGEDISAPECDCLACGTLMEEGIDTREYGSNENNMGRAAHNMNMLMKAQRIAVNGTTALVSCVGKKATTPQPAKDLYRSAWFIKARRWAELNSDRWYILSAEHGLLHPDEIICPYEKTLNDMSMDDRVKWEVMVYDQICEKVPKGQLLFLAGKKYRDNILGILEANGYYTNAPMEGLGIGQQLSWLNANTLEQGRLFND
jgi:hypothetical protein